jgi:hypothetical protein
MMNRISWGWFLFIHEPSSFAFSFSMSQHGRLNTVPTAFEGVFLTHEVMDGLVCKVR